MASMRPRASRVLKDLSPKKTIRDSVSRGTRGVTQACSDEGWGEALRLPIRLKTELRAPEKSQEPGHPQGHQLAVALLDVRLQEEMELCARADPTRRSAEQVRA